MIENIQHDYFIWEEKNSTEPQKNYENKNASETKDTTNDIQTNVENLHWKDITNPKLRQKAYRKAYLEANKDKIKLQQKAYNEVNKERQKAYLENNKDTIKAYKKDYREVNKDRIKLQQKDYWEANKDKLKIVNKNYYEANKQTNKDKRKTYQKANKDKIKAYKKDYNQANKDKRRVHHNNLYKTDIQYKLIHNLRSRLRSAINNNQKIGSAVKDLGCTIPELKTYLESKFQSGMTWDNWALDGWHIDHIKPLASFDLTDRNQLLEACHYTNLQPLWATDNLIKSDK